MSCPIKCRAFPSAPCFSEGSSSCSTEIFWTPQITTSLYFCPCQPLYRSLSSRLHDCVSHCWTYTLIKTGPDDILRYHLVLHRFSLSFMGSHVNSCHLYAECPLTLSIRSLVGTPPLDMFPLDVQDHLCVISAILH